MVCSKRGMSEMVMAIAYTVRDTWKIPYMQQMNKRLLLSLLLIISASVVHAQTLFGYFSRDSVMRSMSGYVEAMAELEQLRGQYEAEAKREEEEFNVKYEDFLGDIRDLAPAIAQKRQAELQDLMEKNIAFRKEAERLLAGAEAEALTPLKARIETALQRIGRERGFHFIVNTDTDACPYISPDVGEDINRELIDILNGRR